MKKSVILNTYQVKRLQETGTVAVVELVKSQPVHDSLEISNGELLHTQPDGFVDCGQPPIKLPYQPGQQVYVRESITCNLLYAAHYGAGGKVTLGKVLDKDEYIHIDHIDKSERGYIPSCSMPQKLARLFPVVASVECVRCNSVHEDDILNIVETMIVPSGGDDYYDYYRNYLGSQKVEDWPWFNTPTPSLKSFIISKFGQPAWDNNAFIFITTFKI